MKGLNNRQQRIIALLSTARFMSVKDLSKELDVSEMTIRRDIPVLVSNGAVKQVYGGLTYVPDESQVKNYSFSLEKTRNQELKTRIAEVAISMLDNGEVIFLDSGSTVENLAVRLAETDKNLTVITNSFIALEYVTRSNSCSVIVPGGVFNSRSKVFYSQEANTFAEHFRVNKCFIGATGFDMGLGVTCSFLEDGPIKTSMMRNSQDKILLIDSSKFGKVSTFAFAKISDFSCVITDNGIPSEYKDYILSNGVRLIEA